MHPTLKRMAKSFPSFFQNWGYQKKIKGVMEREIDAKSYINYIKNCNSGKQLTELQIAFEKRKKKRPKYKFYAPTPIDCGDPKPSDNDPYNMVDPVDRGHIFP